MVNSFNEFAKVGRKFKITGMSEVYNIIQVDSDKVVVIMIGVDSARGISFPIAIDNAEDSFNIGLWKAIEESQPVNKDGMNCCKCKQFFEFAASNQDDGTMICWSCRNGF